MSPPMDKYANRFGITLDKNEIREMLVITSDIDAEMSMQSAIYSQFAIAAVEAEDEMDRLIIQQKIFEAQKDHDIRLASSKKLNNVEVSSQIMQTEMYKKYSAAILGAKKAKGILDATTRAFQQRAMMLSGMAANKRQEMSQEGSSSIREVDKATRALQKSFDKHTGGKS